MISPQLAHPQLSSCGPIEAGVELGGPWPGGPIRNCQVAAPLKQGRPCPLADRPSHPQLSSCGPIEAARYLGAARRRPNHPQLSSCGPIEASAMAPTLSRYARHPQLSSCGPIEATLKPPRPRHGGRHPQLSSCGPIEARGSFTDASRRGTIRNCQVAAPLKPAKPPPAPTRSKTPSATVKLRPH